MDGAKREQALPRRFPPQPHQHRVCSAGRSRFLAQCSRRRAEQLAEAGGSVAPEHCRHCSARDRTVRQSQCRALSAANHTSRTTRPRHFLQCSFGYLRPAFRSDAPLTARSTVVVARSGGASTTIPAPLSWLRHWLKRRDHPPGGLEWLELSRDYDSPGPADRLRSLCLPGSGCPSGAPQPQLAVWSIESPWPATSRLL